MPEFAVSRSDKGLEGFGDETVIQAEKAEYLCSEAWMFLNKRLP